MNWLQTGVIVVISFLLARIIIDAGIHREIIHRFLSRRDTSFSAFITAILVISWFLSLFFSNTVVVLSMLPIVRAMLEELPHAEDRRKVSTHVALALIYGANSGGMGSLTGSPLNLVYIGFIEYNRIPGRENVTFFSWMLLGVPASLLLLVLCRFILKWGEPRLVIPQFRESMTEKEKTAVPGPRRPPVSRYLIFFIANMLLLLALTAAQFILRPKTVAMNLNPVDIALLIYLSAFLFFSFIHPRRGRGAGLYLRNAARLGVTLLLTPPIYLLETFRAAVRRFHRPSLGLVRRLDNRLHALYEGVWHTLFRESPGALKRRNPNAFVSLNRMIYDLPFYGLFFMTLVLGLAYLLLILGDNPATPAPDGYIAQALESVAAAMTPHVSRVFLFLLILSLISTFVTEFVSNTVVVLALFPLTLKISLASGINPLFPLLAAVIGASSAFMTPIATTVNAIAYAGLEGVSLGRMIRMGFLLNIGGALLIAGLLFCVMTVF